MRKAIAGADLRLYRLARSAARPPASMLVARFSRLGEHAALWLALGAVAAAGRPPPARSAGDALSWP